MVDFLVAGAVAAPLSGADDDDVLDGNSHDVVDVHHHDGGVVVVRGGGVGGGGGDGVDDDHAVARSSVVHVSICTRPDCSIILRWICILVWSQWYGQNSDGCRD